MIKKISLEKCWQKKNEVIKAFCKIRHKTLRIKKKGCFFLKFFCFKCLEQNCLNNYNRRALFCELCHSL